MFSPGRSRYPLIHIILIFLFCRHDYFDKFYMITFPTFFFPSDVHRPESLRHIWTQSIMGLWSDGFLSTCWWRLRLRKYCSTDRVLNLYQCYVYSSLSTSCTNYKPSPHCSDISAQTSSQTNESSSSSFLIWPFPTLTSHQLSLVQFALILWVFHVKVIRSYKINSLVFVVQ